MPKRKWNDGDFESKTAEGVAKEMDLYSKKFRETVERQKREAFERLERKNDKSKN